MDRLLPWLAVASAKAAEDDARWFAEGARYQAEKPRLICQRVEPPSHRYDVPRDNAFHLALIGHIVPGGSTEAIGVIRGSVALRICKSPRCGAGTAEEFAK